MRSDTVTKGVQQAPHRSLFNALGMTQEELANRVGVRRKTISRLEKGQYNPSLKLAMDIAAVFSLPVESLFFFYDDGQPLEK